MRTRCVLILLASLSCTEKKAPPAPAEVPASQQPKSPASGRESEPAPLPPLPDPVARIGETEIGRSQFQARFDEVLSRYQRANTAIRPDLKARLRANLLRRLVEAEVIRQKAVEMGVEPSPDEIEAAWTAHKEGFGGPGGFEAYAKRSGSSEEGLRLSFVQNLRRSRVIEEGVRTKAPTVSELRAFYDGHPNYFDRPPEVRLRQLLFPTGTPDAQRKAEAALKRVRGGDSFEEVYADAAIDPADRREGDLGFLPRHRLTKPVAEVAFDQLEPGQLSGIIESPYGLHIVRKEAERPARTLDFDEARALIEQRMTAQRRNRDVREALERWKKSAEIEVFLDVDVLSPPSIQPDLPVAPRLDTPALLEHAPGRTRRLRQEEKK